MSKREQAMLSARLLLVRTSLLWTMERAVHRAKTARASGRMHIVLTKQMGALHAASPTESSSRQFLADAHQQRFVSGRHTVFCDSVSKK
jgi:hypothetical protein